MLPINKTYLSNNCSYDYNNPQYIVVHYTGVKNKHLASTIAKNIYEGIVGGSAHYSVDDTSIYQAVPDHRGAWAVGDDEGYGVYPFGITNQNSISIEMASSGNYIISQKTRENTAELVAYLLKKYGLGIDRVKRHYQW